jgi:hypothetical protein
MWSILYTSMVLKVLSRRCPGVELRVCNIAHFAVDTFNVINRLAGSTRAVLRVIPNLQFAQCKWYCNVSQQSGCRAPLQVKRGVLVRDF